MATTVVNIRSDAYDAYIGRAGHGHDGRFGNPFKPESGMSAEDARHWCLHQYRSWFAKRVSTDWQFRADVLALRGKRLGCFCAPPGGFKPGDPQRCHGQIIAAWIDSQPQEDCNLGGRYLEYR